MTDADKVSILPPLSLDQALHCERVLESLRALIQARGGWLRFDEYMQQVLYAPGLGYYSAGSAKFGADGDFITAPELSPLFGRCLARQCAQVLEGGDILELGAGSGALAATVLETLQTLEALPRRYAILEVSADLRQRQQQRLAQLPSTLRSRVEWLNALPQQPLSGVVLANEVADALPVRRFLMAGADLYERGIALDTAGALAEADVAAEASLRAEIAQLGGDWPEPYQSEFCPVLKPWVAAIGAALERGAWFLIDYGLARAQYYHPQRSAGTLRCHFRHRAHDDALLYPGLQDITAWVDFTRVAEAAVEAGFEIGGYCTQTAFLLATGIEADIAAAGSPREAAVLASQARQLLLPGEMGENFKVMALTRGIEAPLRGFALQDLQRGL